MESSPGLAAQWEPKTPDDLLTKLQRIRHQNAVLESERDYYRQMYEKAVEQKEVVRKKAKDAVRLMRAIYKDYEELQGILRTKEQHIEDLKAKTKFVESKPATNIDVCPQITRLIDEETGLGSPIARPPRDMAPSGSGLRPAFEAMGISASGTMIFEEEFVRHGKSSAAAVDSSILQTPNSSALGGIAGVDMSDECAALRARVAELEGILVGTLYHSARKDNPHQLTQKDLAPFTPAKHVDPGTAVANMINALLTASRTERGSNEPIARSADFERVPIPMAALYSEIDDKDNKFRTLVESFDGH